MSQKNIINKFLKVVGLKSNIQILLVFLYTKKKLFEKEINKIISFTVALEKKNKLNQDVKDLHKEN